MTAAIHARQLRVLRVDPLTGERREVICDLDLDIAVGERVALVGPNGAGKTSLLMALIGAAPYEGRLEVLDQPLRPENLAAVRAQLGFVFADPGDQLFCETVEDEVAFGPNNRGLAPAEVEARVASALQQVDLEHARARSPRGLSLGEQRRLALATALATQPKILLLDEPTASLDGRARRQLLSTLSDMAASLVIATHDLDAVLSLAARAVVLADGRHVASGPARDLLANRSVLDRAGLDPPLGL